MQTQAAEAGMSAECFWGSTPRDVRLTIKGYGQRMERLRGLLGWLGAPLAGAWGAKTAANAFAQAARGDL